MSCALLAIDQGTTGTKVMAMDPAGRVLGTAYRTHRQIYPRPGWVEHDPEEIWQAIQSAVKAVMAEASLHPRQVAAVGLDNQGETVLAWDAESGKPLANAIVWSCRRTEELAAAWAQDKDWALRVRQKTGLRIDAYFSATKVRWLLDAVPAVRSARSLGILRVGTLDSWLLWQMSGGRAHVTDPSTASRTLLYNIHSRCWDEEILAYLGIPRDVLAQVVPSVGEVCTTDPEAFLGIEAPVTVSLVDQPAALYGHLCFEPGAVKCTYGTGCFVYMYAGSRPVASNHDLLTTLLWDKGGSVAFALEGGVYTAGAAVNWLQALGLLGAPGESDGLAASAQDADVVFVPAFSGLAAPHWDARARGAFLGLTAATGRAEIVRAVLEGVAQRVADVVEAMAADVGGRLPYLRADGGMARNAFLMQWQADLLGVPVEASSDPDVTVRGTAMLVGEVLGWWSQEELERLRPPSRRFEPRLGDGERRRLRERWAAALAAVRQYGASGLT